MDYVILAVFGLVFGSFLNVCIYRIPRGESIVRPRSHCTRCKHMIPWYENIPVLSFLMLRARCSSCGKKISFVYPIVEILTALLSVVIYIHFGLSPHAIIYFVLFSSLILVSFVDFERQEIPDVISLPGIGVGLCLAFLYPDLFFKPRGYAVLESFLGILVGGGSLYILGFVGELIFKKEAMGGGDIKLLAMIGAFLGWKLVVVTFFLAPVLGVTAAIVMKIRKQSTLPYGPYLSLGAFVALLWGDVIFNRLWGDLALMIKYMITGKIM